FGDRVEHLRTWCAATTGMRSSCSPERMRPWSTRRTASPPEGDRLAPFGSPAGVSPPSRASVGHLITDGGVTAARLPLNRRSHLCHPGKQANPPTPPPLHAPPLTAPLRHPVEITGRSRTAMGVNMPRRPTRTDPDRLVPPGEADPATLSLPRFTTPAPTLASGGRRHGATAASTPLAAGHPTNCDNEQFSAGMTATLFAELEERAAVDLVADIVRGVLDESRQSVQDRAAESAMIAARQRLERLIRAG